MTALPRRKGHVEPPVGNRRLTHQRIAEPLLPDEFAGARFDHDHRTTLRVKGDIAVFHHSGRRPVVRSLRLPTKRAGLRVEGIKLVRAVTAADKDNAVCVSRRRNGPAAGNAQSPASAAVRRHKRRGLQVLFERWQGDCDGAVEIDLHLSGLSFRTFCGRGFFRLLCGGAWRGRTGQRRREPQQRDDCERQRATHEPESLSANTVRHNFLLQPKRHTSAFGETTEREVCTVRMASGFGTCSRMINLLPVIVSV